MEINRVHDQRGDSEGKRRRMKQTRRRNFCSTYHEHEQQQHQQKQQAFESWSLWEGDELSGSCCWFEGIFDGVGCCWRRDRLLSKIDEFSWFDWRVLIICRKSPMPSRGMRTVAASYLTEGIVLHFFDLTDNTLCESEKDVGSWPDQHQIGRWSWMRRGTTIMDC